MSESSSVAAEDGGREADAADPPTDRAGVEKEGWEVIMVDSFPHSPFPFLIFKLCNSLQHFTALRLTRGGIGKSILPKATFYHILRRMAWQLALGRLTLLGLMRRILYEVGHEAHDVDKGRARSS